MKIIILGAGEVGVHIASSLRREGHDLVLIEKNPKKVSELQRKLDILAIKGDGCNASLLREQGAGGADLFFAVSNNDPVNLLAALTARQMGAKRCVVRVGDVAHGQNPLLKRDKNIKLLYPERLVAEEIHSMTRVPGASKARFFADGRLVMLHARPSDQAQIYGRPLKHLLGPSNWILTGIHRASGTVIPRGDTELKLGDVVYGIGPTDTIPEFLASIGVKARPTNRVVIAGAGQVGASLARMLVAEKIDVVLINRSKDRAFQLAGEIPEALVLQGDATNPEILREAGVEDADYFVAATQNDEVNLLSSLLAGEIGAHVTTALYNQPEFLNLLKVTRVDVPISPRMMIAGSITRMVHRREIVSLDIVEGGDAEIVGFQVPARAKVLKKPLSKLHFPKRAIVGPVIRNDEFVMPGGDFMFKEGDQALIFTLSEALPELERMFRGR